MQSKKTPSAQPWRAPAPEAALGLDGAAGRRIRAFRVPAAPFKFALHCRLGLSGPRAPLVAPAAR